MKSKTIIINQPAVAVCKKINSQKDFFQQQTQFQLIKQNVCIIELSFTGRFE